MIDASEFRTVMGNLGERFQMHEIEELMRVPELDADGRIKYEGVSLFCPIFVLSLSLHKTHLTGIWSLRPDQVRSALQVDDCRTGFRCAQGEI